MYTHKKAQNLNYLKLRKIEYGVRRREAAEVTNKDRAWIA